MADVPPTTFNLNEDEKAILRRTLRVIALEPNRIEFAVKRRFLSSTPLLLEFLHLAMFVIGSLAVLSLPLVRSLENSSFGSLNLGLHLAPEAKAFFLVVSPLVALAFFLNKGLFSRYESRPIRSICLFAGTAWCICRRRPKPSYELLVRLEPIVKTIGQPHDLRFRLRTDLRLLMLKQRRFDEWSVKKAREILARLVADCSRFPLRSATVEVAAACDEAAVDLPRERYAAVVDQDWLVSLSPNEMALRDGRHKLGIDIALLVAMVGDLGIFCWALYLLRPVESLDVVSAWIRLGAATLLLRLPILSIPRGLVRIQRRDNVLLVTGRAGAKQFPSSTCDVVREERALGGEVGGSAWFLSICAYRSEGRAGVHRAMIGSWQVASSKPALPAGERAAVEERQAVNVEAALRCYLGLPSVQAGCLGRPASEVD